jgi:porin
VAYAQISRGARGFDRDANRFAGVTGPVRDHELAVEFTYQTAVTARWSLQPTVQYIVHPGGGAAGPDGRRIPSALVLGVRNSARF